MAKLRGLEIKMDWKPNEAGELMAHVRIKRWYIPIFLVKSLHNCNVPFRFWPLIYWRHYTGYVRRQGL